VDRIDDIRAFAADFIEAIMAGKQVPQLFTSPTYWNYIRSEAALIGTDGCSGVTGARIDCCMEHDLSYAYARDPRNAYRQFRGGRFSDSWAVALPIDRAEADRRFRQCLMNRSILGRYSGMAWWRWAGVRIGGRGIWARHRQREAETAAGV
jgi:hypothetical protein